jgi:hypothetical protein
MGQLGQMNSDLFTEVEDDGMKVIVFASGSKELLKLCGDGSIFVKGRKTTEDLSVVEALRTFLRDSGHLKLSPSENAGKTMIEFGKFKGRRMEEIDIVDFEDYVDWLANQGKLNNHAETFVATARVYLSGDPAGGTYRAPKSSQQWDYDDSDSLGSFYDDGWIPNRS